MFHKIKNKNNKYFCKSCLQCFSSKNVLTKDNELGLKINAAQSSVKLEKGAIKFKNIFKQILFSFKFFCDTGCILSKVESCAGSCWKQYQDHIPCSFAYKLVCVDDNFSKPIVFYRGKNAASKFIETILEKFEYYKKVMKKYFNKNFITAEEEEEQFQWSNTCWICEKLIDDEDKIRDHCYITEKFRGAAHWRCNANLQLTKNLVQKI